MAGGSQITTTAHVEVNHHLSDGEVEEGEVKQSNFKREDSDSDVSPHGKHRIKKRRKAVRRAQSAAECREYYREKPKQNRSNMSLPQGTKLSDIKIDISEEITGGNIFRPRSECIIRQRRPSTSNSKPNIEMTIVELESSPKHNRRDDLLEKMDAENDERPKYRRSMSEDRVFVPFNPKPYSSPLTQDTNIKTSQKEDIDNCKMKETKKGKESLDKKEKSLSSQQKELNSTDVQVPKKEKVYKKKARPNSAGDINKLDKVKMEKAGFNLSAKPKDLPLKQSIKNAEGTSQKSSTVGLDWLFSTDSDSISSGEGKVKGHRTKEVKISLKTLLYFFH